jgi:hypothetical protein
VGGGCRSPSLSSYAFLLYHRASKRLFFVILSPAKNLFFTAMEILHSAALRSE